MNRAIAVGQYEAELLDLYGNPREMEKIQNQNQGLAEMIDPREKVGWGWWVLTMTALGIGLGASVKYPRAGAALATTSALAVGSLGYSSLKNKLEHSWRRAWRLN